MHHFRSNPPSRGIKPRPAMTPAARLLRAVEDHLDEQGIAPSAFARTVTGSTRLIAQLRGGAMPAAATVERIRNAIAGEASHG